MPSAGTSKFLTNQLTPFYSSGMYAISIIAIAIACLVACQLIEFSLAGGAIMDYEFSINFGNGRCLRVFNWF